MDERGLADPRLADDPAHHRAARGGSVERAAQLFEVRDATDKVRLVRCGACRTTCDTGLRGRAGELLQDLGPGRPRRRVAAQQRDAQRIEIGRDIRPQIGRRRRVTVLLALLPGGLLRRRTLFDPPSRCRRTAVPGSPGGADQRRPQKELP